MVFCFLRIYQYCETFRHQRKIVRQISKPGVRVGFPDQPVGCSFPHNDRLAAHYPVYYTAIC